MDTKDLSKRILVNIGGSQNVNNATHCATRLRITVKDEAQINKDKIDGLDGVLGSVNSGGQFQIIIGQNVGHVYEAFSAELEGTSDKVEKKEVIEASEDKKKSVFSNILDTITGIFTPLLPAITAAAMIKTLLVLLDLFHLIDPTGGTYKVLTFAGDTAFYFMPVLVAFSASLKFKLNPYLGALMGLILIHPSFVTIVADKNPINLFGFLPVTLANYSSTVIPV
ncbi:putative phosphotransferase system, eiib, partial [Listeria ivanovii FSL F6-596]